MIKYSVIIPVYNTVSECLDILSEFKKISLNRKDIELIIIDDGSKNGTNAVLFEFENVYYEYKENNGVSSARNDGIKKAQGEYVLFWDSDDEFYFDVFDILDERLECHDFVCFNYKKKSHDGKIKEYVNNACCYNEKEFLYNAFLKKININICASVFKRDVILKNKLVFSNEITHCEDLLFIFQYLKYINSVLVDDFVVFTYLYRSDSAMNSTIKDSNLSIFDALDIIREEYKSEFDSESCYYIMSHYLLFYIKLINTKKLNYKYVDLYFKKASLFYKIKPAKNSKYYLLFLMTFNSLFESVSRLFFKIKCSV